MIVSLTPMPDFFPVPRIEVRIEDAISWDGGDPDTDGPDSFSGGTPNTSGEAYSAGNPFTVEITVPDDADEVTFWRICDGRDMKVRGGVRRKFLSGLAILDYEAPFEECTYEAEFFASGESLVRVPLGSVVLPWTGDPDAAVIQQPLDPHLNVTVRNMTGSWPELTREAPGDLVTVEGGVYPALVGSGPLRALVGVELDFEAPNRETAAAVWGLYRSGGTYHLPVWLIRAPKRGLLPPVFFARVNRPTETDVTVSAPAAIQSLVGSISRFTATVDEVAPPAVGLVMQALSYDDLDVSFESYDDMDAAFSTYPRRDSAWEYAGAAG